jgi:sec-independent protein translocase protein TatA
MGAMSLSHILVVVLLAVLLFGRGRISDIMGDVAKGIRSFRKGLAEDEHALGPVGRIGQQEASGAVPSEPSRKG